MLRLLATGSLALLLGACSMNFPMASLFAKDDDVTGSIKPAAAPPSQPPVALAREGQTLALLSPDLGQEDLRRAKGAMVVALDPQGNGSPVSWDNPETKRKGVFTPVGVPYVQSDEICRAFLAGVDGPSTEHRVQGTACRPSGGEWSLRDLKPLKAPA